MPRAPARSTRPSRSRAGARSSACPARAARPVTGEHHESGRAWLVAVAVSVFAMLVAVTPLVAHAAVGDVSLVSRGAADAPPANGDSGPGLALSASGRYVAFESKASNLSDAALPGVTNIYLRDTKDGTTTLVSRATGADGAGADGD